MAAMMTFAFPAFLSGLLLLSVPLILHLMKRKPEFVRRFPSLFLFRKSLARKERRNSLLKYLVLICRLLGFACLALGFAYPVTASYRLKPQEATVVLIDGSFSMADDISIQRWLSAMSPENPTLFCIVSNSLNWSGNFESSRNGLETWFEENRKTFRTSSFRTALLAADSRLGSLPAKNRRIVVLTDGQRVPWERVDFSRRLRNTSELKIEIPVRQEGGNLAVESVKRHQPYTEGVARISVVATVRNYNPAPQNVNLSVRLDDREVDRAELTVPANGKAEAEFSLLPGKEFRPHAGEIRLYSTASAANRYCEDDIRYFALNPVSTPRIFYSGSAGFIPEVLAVQRLEKDSVQAAEKADLLIFDSVPPGAAALAETQMKNGGTAVILRNASRESAALLEHFGIRTRRKSVPGVQHLAMLQFEHPVLRDYLKVNAGSWFDVLFFDVPLLTVPPDASVLAAFDNGAPAILERRVGAGRLFVFAARPGREATNWQTFGNFLPFWRELALFSAKPQKIPAELTADGSALTLPDGSALTLDKPGNYRADGCIYSVNVPSAESDPASVDASGFAEKLLDPAAKTRLEKELLSRDERLKAASPASSAWRLLLAAALIFFLLEFLFANRTVRG